MWESGEGREERGSEDGKGRRDVMGVGKGKGKKGGGKRRRDVMVEERVESEVRGPKEGQTKVERKRKKDMTIEGKDEGNKKEDGC